MMEFTNKQFLNDAHSAYETKTNGNDTENKAPRMARIYWKFRFRLALFLCAVVASIFANAISNALRNPMKSVKKNKESANLRST